MIPVTISAPGYDAVTVNLMPAGQGASRPDAPSAGDFNGGTVLRNGQRNFTPDMAAGATYTATLEVADSDEGSVSLEVGQGSPLGGSRKTVTLEKDGVVIQVGAAEQNTVNAAVSFGNPSGPNYLAPGVWALKIKFFDPGAAAFVISG